MRLSRWESCKLASDERKKPTLFTFRTIVFCLLWTTMILCCAAAFKSRSRFCVFRMRRAIFHALSFSARAIPWKMKPVECARLQKDESVFLTMDHLAGRRFSRRSCCDVCGAAGISLAADGVIWRASNCVIVGQVIHKKTQFNFFHELVPAEQKALARKHFYNELLTPELHFKHTLNITFGGYKPHNLNLTLFRFKNCLSDL